MPRLARNDCGKACLAVSAVQVGVAEHPADLLDEMRARFLIHGTRSPFSWASRLRMCGKKVRHSTTCLGYISWSEDKQAVSYKAVHGLSMDVVRDFVAKQVAAAQGQLESLLRLYSEQKSEDLELSLRMHRIVDDASRTGKARAFCSTRRTSTVPFQIAQTGCLTEFSNANGYRRSFP